MDELIHIKRMAHSKLRNYVIPGLTSWLVGNNPDPGRGCVRLFECSREHQEAITPHSHRFDFQCLVIAGEVTNWTWTPVADDEAGDLFCVTDLRYTGAPGQYTDTLQSTQRFAAEAKTYTKGKWYSMKHDEIHSIYFSRGAAVLFFEGPQISDSTQILEPYVDGVRIPTFKVQPWMFKKTE